MSQSRTSTKLPPNCNLYCTSCDSQIGIFENEWIHLTTSYARSQEKGTHFGTKVGIKTQVVPAGSAQQNAEGCEMSEVHCTKCLTVVAQYCRTAPDASKQQFVGHYFYKISRVYLKDSHTSTNVDMNFADGDNDQSQKVLNSARSSAAPRQKLPPPRAASDVPFRQSFPPPSSQNWQWTNSQPSSIQPSFPYDFRSASAQPSFDCHHNQLATLAECASRITASDMRLANQEMRFNTSQEQFHNLENRFNHSVDLFDNLDKRFCLVEGKVKALGADCEGFEEYNKELDQRIVQQEERIEERIAALENENTQLGSYFHEHDTVIKEQQRKIEEQNQELRRVTTKLEELQSVMGQLKTSINEYKSQTASNSHLVSLPNSQESLQTLEGMVKAIKNTQVEPDELQALRDENTKMKTRLRTIAGAIGLTPQDELNLPGNEIAVLGKRKRAAENKADQQRKATRFSNPSLKEAVLPTPDSSQTNVDSPLGATNEDVITIESETGDARDDGSLLCTADPVEESESQVKQTAGMLSGEATRAEVEHRSNQDCDLVATNTPTALYSGRIRMSSDQHADTTAGDPQEPAQPHHHHVLAAPNKAIEIASSAVATARLLQQSTVRKPTISFNSNRPISMMERMRSPSIRNSTAPLPFSESLGLPSSQLKFTSDRNKVQLPRERRSITTFQRRETFSGALSRGETLENLVQRSQTPQVTERNHAVRENDEGTEEQQQRNHREDRGGENQILQQCEDSELNIRNATLSKNQLLDPNLIPVVQSVEFSDEENEPFANLRHVSDETVSRTPAGEPKSATTLVSRAFPGLTFEPLVRPVIEQENDGNSCAGSRRHSVSSLQTPNAAPIMPEILAAIKNLNDCVVTQSPKPTESTSVPRITRTKSIAKKAKGGRKSEPISKVMHQQLGGDEPATSTTVTRSKSSGKKSTNSFVVSEDKATDLTSAEKQPLPNENNSFQQEEIEDTAAPTEPIQEANVASPENPQPKQSKAVQVQKLNNMKKSLSRQELLMERNRLAMEAMEREDAGQRLEQIMV